MFGQIYNHGTLKKYVIYFGTLFNDIYLTRDNPDGTRDQTMKVPINYGPKEKFLARLKANPDLNRPVAIQLPRMSFEITNFQYASERKLTSIGRITATNPADHTKKNNQYNPVPYDIQFTLYVMVKNAEDGTRIIEQILPYFTPEWTSTLKIDTDLGIEYDVPVVLNSVHQEDTYEGNFETRRAIIWTLTFTMKGYIFGPTRSSNIIKQTEINIAVPSGDVATANTTTAASNIHITIKPGLMANGSPTSNAALSIDKSLILPTDNYGFIIDFQENG